MYEFQDNDVICSCKHMTKKHFLALVKEQKLDTIDQVREKTEVNVACGMCIMIVEKLLAENLP